MPGTVLDSRRALRCPKDGSPGPVAASVTNRRRILRQKKYGDLSRSCSREDYAFALGTRGIAMEINDHRKYLKLSLDISRSIPLIKGFDQFILPKA